MVAHLEVVPVVVVLWFNSYQLYQIRLIAHNTIFFANIAILFDS
jgi:hypothetical protein